MRANWTVAACIFRGLGRTLFSDNVRKVTSRVRDFVVALHEPILPEGLLLGPYGRGALSSWEKDDPEC